MSAPHGAAAPVETDRQEEQAERARSSAGRRLGIQRYAILIVFAAMVAAFGLAIPSTFLTIGNLSNILGSQAVLFIVRAAAAHMKKQRSGSIVVTASTAGLRNDPFTPYSYAVAKAGIVNFTKQAAHDLARWNVRVNAIAPGPFKTNLGGALLQGPALPPAG
jgi:NAD(P)-dependent dehydrogenase (short-subunit alcohol dehydrogenase family)